jgi:hypothetical protein
MYGRFGHSRLARNTVRRGTTGIYLVPDVVTGDADTVFVRLDTNAVSQTTSQAVYLYPYDVAAIEGVRNNISGNANYGLRNTGSGTRSFTLGRFRNNGDYSVYSTAAFDATQNWWGEAAGPGGFYGTGSTLADSVYSSAVVWDPALTADPTDVPSLSPPSVASGAAPTAVVAGTSEPPAAPADPNGRLQQQRRAEHERRVSAMEAVKQAEWEQFMALLERIRAERHARGDGGNR